MAVNKDHLTEQAIAAVYGSRGNIDTPMSPTFVSPELSRFVGVPTAQTEHIEEKRWNQAWGEVEEQKDNDSNKGWRINDAWDEGKWNVGNWRLDPRG